MSAHALGVFVTQCESPILSSQKTHYLHVNAISFHFPLLHMVCNSVFYNLSTAPGSQVAEGVSQLILVCLPAAQSTRPHNPQGQRQCAAVKG